MNYRLYTHLYLHSKIVFTFKKASTFANLLMEKPGTDFLQQKYEKNTRRKIKFKKGPASLLKISLWDSFQCLLVQIKYLASP